MGRVTVTARAIDQIAEIVAHVAADDLKAARRLEARLWAAADTLAEFPARGRPVGAGLRELVNVPPYIIRYRVSSGGVEVFSIFHAARHR